MRRDLVIKAPQYLKFIRSKSCCVCTRIPVDCDHLQARGWGSAKQNDLTGIPLCRAHHSERGQIGNQRFETKYEMNLWHEVSMCLIEFFLDVERRRDVDIFVSDKGASQIRSQMNDKKNNAHPSLQTTNLESTICHEQMGTPEGNKLDKRVCIHIHSKRKRITDPDGISGKAAIDGLAKGCLLRDDSTKYVKEVSFSQEESEEEETVIDIVF